MAEHEYAEGADASGRPSPGDWVDLRRPYDAGTVPLPASVAGRPRKQALFDHIFLNQGEHQARFFFATAGKPAWRTNFPQPGPDDKFSPTTGSGLPEGHHFYLHGLRLAFDDNSAASQRVRARSTVSTVFGDMALNEFPSRVLDSVRDVTVRGKPISINALQEFSFVLDVDPEIDLGEPVGIMLCLHGVLLKPLSRERVLTPEERARLDEALRRHLAEDQG